jgi:Zn finger protein HypA/HybF involved in hydrogenase expression
MTLMLLEDTLSEEEQLELLASPTVKCSWCGALIRIDGEELALAMCPSCYERMLAEYERSLKTRQTAVHVSDR